MLIFTLEVGMKKDLRLRIAEKVEKTNTKEKNKVIRFTIKKLNYSKNVVPFQEEPSETLMYVIPVLIKQIQGLAGSQNLERAIFRISRSISIIYILDPKALATKQLMECNAQ
jgi:hypothetical protein